MSGNWSKFVMRIMVNCAVIGIFLMLGMGIELARAESLIEALTSTYQNNPTLQGQRARLRAVDEGVAQALSDWRPKVEFKESGSKIRQRNNSSTPKESRTPYSSTLSLTQLIYDGGSKVAATRQAESEVIAARARLASVEQQILLDAVIAYMNVVRDEAIRRFNVNNEQVLTRQLEATRDRFSVGELTRTDVAQAESRVAGAIADRRQAEGNLQVSRSSYQQVIGSIPEALTSPILSHVPVENGGQAARLAESDNPDVLAAIYDEAAANNRVRAIMGEVLPVVDLTANASHARNQTIDDRTTNTLSVTAALTIPLYQSGSVSARVRQAKQLASFSRRQIEEARRAAIRDATSAWETLVATQARIKALESQVNTARIALDGVSQEAMVGSRTVLDVLDAEQELLNAQVGLVGAQRDEVVAHFELLVAVGGLTAQKLSLPVDPYDEKEYYNRVRNKWWGLNIGTAE